MELSNEQKELITTSVDDILDNMGGTPIAINTDSPATTEKKPNPLIDGILEWGKTIEFDKVTDNSVLIVKINVEDEEYSRHFQMAVVKHVLEPRFQILKEKKVTVLFMTHRDDISIISENDMNKAGWVKKEQSLIIRP
jgi:hypothetical protein